MLTFFRRTRKGLLGSGATGKYLLYAIGEIGLVVVGILIALQINNWNEERLERQEEYELLQGLENQFDKMHQALLYWAEFYDSCNVNAFKILDPMVSIDDLSAETILNGLKAIRWAGTFDPGKGVLESLMESGRLELIENDLLRDRLSHWPSTLLETMDNEILMREFISNEIIPVMTPLLGHNIGRTIRKHYIGNFFSEPISEMELISFKNLLKSKNFIGLATYRYVWLKGSKTDFYNAANYAKEVLELIRIESRIN